MTPLAELPRPRPAQGPRAQVAQQADLAAVMCDLFQSVQRGFRQVSSAQPPGPMPIGANRRSSPRAAIDGVLPVLCERLDAFFAAA